MTFSLLLRDPETGEFGSAISSSSPAVAARCVNLADGVGGAHSQNVTDPRLGVMLLDALKAGHSASAAMAAVAESADPETIQFRQLLAIDAAGETAVYSGPRALGTFGASQRENAVAAGNMLASLEVLEALVDAALAATGPIERRLIAGMRAAVAAGGEEGPLHSAGLAVVGDAGWRVTDLRVDWADDDPVEALAELTELWLPQRDDYVTRGRDPRSAPSYGVPGDD